MKPYKSYRFIDKDPVIDAMRTAFQDSGETYQRVHDGSGVSIGTMRGWFTGKTRRPQFATVAAFMGVLGKESRWVDKKRK